MKKHITKTPTDLYYKSPRPHDRRIGEMAKAGEWDSLQYVEPNDFVILGYPDDLGIKLNHGLAGAKEAPNQIRRALYKLTPKNNNTKIYDIGNLICSENIKETQSSAKEILHGIHQKKSRIITFGGGNDFAYPDISAFLTKYPKGLVLHIDAHFDMRPAHETPNSGTPLAQCFIEHGLFSLTAIGIQDFSNTEYFFDFAKSKKAKVYEFKKSHGKLAKIFSSIATLRRPTFLAIDMDAFSSAFAPGVSSPAAIGLCPNEFYIALNTLFARLDVRGLGIYETNPNQDINHRTSQLAALFTHAYIFQELKNQGAKKMFDQPKRNSIGSDNHSGIHPEVLKALIQANQGHSPSYGTDPLTTSVQSELKNIFGKNAETNFVFNGTAANVLCLKSLVKSHEAVICAQTSHLHLDECGAPEAFVGCKLLDIESKDGKITPEQILPYLIRGGDQHYSQPRLLSITQPTEYGTVYSLEELRELREFTRKHNLYLHIDGARLIYAAHYLNCSLMDLTQNLDVDAVSFGGTKNGLLFGEIVIIYNEEAKRHFKFIRKQAMQLPSKMRFLAAQFESLLLNKTEIWRQIAAHGHSIANYLKEQVQDFPEVKITQKVQANSVFARIPKKWHKELKETLFYYVWDEHSYSKTNEYEVRWMVSFDTEKTDVDQFVKKMHSLRSSST